MDDDARALVRFATATAVVATALILLGALLQRLDAVALWGLLRAAAAPTALMGAAALAALALVGGALAYAEHVVRAEPEPGRPLDAALHMALFPAAILGAGTFTTATLDDLPASDGV